MRPVTGSSRSPNGIETKRPPCSETIAALPPLEQILGGAVAEVAAVLHVVGNRVGAAQLVADVVRDERHLDAETREPGLDLALQQIAEVDLGETDVAVLVVLDVLEAARASGRVEKERQSLGEHGDAVMAAPAQTLDDGAGQNVDQGGESAPVPCRTPPG